MFKVGKHYSRLNDIHLLYGGGRQGGISASRTHPFIFLFSGESGKDYGYEDGWQPNEDTFLYTGEGQEGDMSFTRGNKAIRDHLENGKQLMLFEALGKGKPVEFIGQFDCASHDAADATDRAGHVRKAIRFHLVPIDVEQTNAQYNPTMEPNKKIASLSELRARALQAVKPKQKSDWRIANQIRHQRRQDIKDYVLRRADGKCELTGKIAPFKRNNGEAFLEVHHIKRLSDGGLDHPFNCAAISPNAHREIHYGANGKDLDEKLAIIISDKEANFIDG